MLKVLVIGSPGAGKSTFARKLSAVTGLPLYYLDLLWHKPDKTNLAAEEFDLRLNEMMEKTQWIIDGNYLRTLAKLRHRIPIGFSTGGLPFRGQIPHRQKAGRLSLDRS